MSVEIHLEAYVSSYAKSRTGAENDHVALAARICSLADMPHGVRRPLSGMPALAATVGLHLRPSVSVERPQLQGSRPWSKEAWSASVKSIPYFVQPHSIHASGEQHWHVRGLSGPYVIGRTSAEKYQCCSCRMILMDIGGCGAWLLSVLLYGVLTIVDVLKCAAIVNLRACTASLPSSTIAERPVCRRCNSSSAQLQPS